MKKKMAGKTAKLNCTLTNTTTTKTKDTKRAKKTGLNFVIRNLVYKKMYKRQG